MSGGKVVLVPFPLDDLSAVKLRPALCLTDPTGPHQHTVLAFITSVAPKDLEDTDFFLDTGDPDFQQTGLRVSSTVRLHRLLTVSATLIVRELGTLSAIHMNPVNERLRKLFNL